MDNDYGTISSPYTICLLENEEQKVIIDRYVEEKLKMKDKSSYCRFFLRGICIMKP